MHNLITFYIVFTNKNGGGGGKIQIPPPPPSKLGVFNTPSKLRLTTMFHFRCFSKMWNYSNKWILIIFLCSGLSWCWRTVQWRSAARRRTQVKPGWLADLQLAFGGFSASHLFIRQLFGRNTLYFSISSFLFYLLGIYKYISLMNIFMSEILVFKTLQPKKEERGNRREQRNIFSFNRN